MTKKICLIFAVIFCVIGISWAADYASMDVSGMVAAMSSMDSSAIAADVIAVANSDDTMTTARLVDAVNQHMTTIPGRAEREALAGDIVSNTSNIVPGEWTEKVTTIVFVKDGKRENEEKYNEIEPLEANGFNDGISQTELNIFDITVDKPDRGVSFGPVRR